MKQNRVLALCYRIAACLLCLAGILDTLGVFEGRFAPGILLYYTTESNLFVLAVLAALLVKTALDIRRGGRAGSTSYCERISAAAAVAISVTMLVFWALLAPGIPWSWLSSFSNLQVHTFTPLLMIFDFLFFAEPGKITNRDPWLCALIPAAYFIQSTSLGLLGFTYTEFSGQPTRFPYFFLDFDQIGANVFVYGIGIAALFVGLSCLLRWIDRRRAGLLPGKTAGDAR
ncbi:MAG: Pr6Pr family membrane protein [Oscillospiraceae bacterium]|nr:Pr6Pr family membrane protein [Oscillospiraceae bacterium]